MSVFAVSVKMGSAGNPRDRLKSLVEKVSVEAVGRHWADGDTLFIMESPKTAADLGYFLLHGTEMNPKYDRIFVIDISGSDYAANGAVESPRALRLLMGQR
jgi:hypothetical protein